MDPSLITTTQAVDTAFTFIIGVCVVLLLGITATTVAFVIRYHRSRAPEPTSQVSGNVWIEIVWTALPTLLVMVMFYYGWAGYLTLRDLPKDAVAVTATARQWSWEFTYANGKNSPKLYVPAGKPVRARPPIQCFSFSGSVHAAKTFAGGALNRRLMVRLGLMAAAVDMSLTPRMRRVFRARRSSRPGGCRASRRQGIAHAST